MLPAPVDWSRPWLTPLRDAGTSIYRSVQGGLSVAQALNTGGSAPVVFVDSSSKPAGQAYESFIARTRQVPTRNNLHDFFNGLVWLHWPQTKLALNSMQAASIAEHGIGPRRGPLRDALTLMDENLALVVCAPQTWVLLKSKQWSRLMVQERRAHWAQTQVWLFGHALLEKLCAPWKAITAHALYLPMGMTYDGADAWLSTHLQAFALEHKPFAALPVLGVPGWWPQNEVPDFYADTRVFKNPPLEKEVSSLI